MHLTRHPRVLTAVFLAAALSACGAEQGYEGSSAHKGDSPPPPDPLPGVASGQLTAGVWDDNLNFDLFAKYLEATKSITGTPELTMEEREAAHESLATRTPKALLDIAFVIDTTGSMRDEIEYLRAEIGALARNLQISFPYAQQRFALVAYGDEGDIYEVDATNFVANATTFQSTLANQELTGGGDYPEASHRGLEVMNQLSWRKGAVARLAFWVADAPHHVEHTGRITAAMRAARAKDIHIYPVASSGVDERTENSMRSAAQLTGGRYIFLTDDSGIGNAHKEPTIPCYFVTRLDDALERMIEIEMTGQYREPAADAVIRTGGDPKNGRCELEGGEQVVIF